MPDDPDATITEGHYAVFDGYWDSTDKTLNLNLCPPAVEHTTEIRTDPVTYLEEKVEVSRRTASNVDIQRTVIHINGSDFEHTLTAADVEEYDFFKLGDGDNNGVDDAIDQTVWWLKVDDPSTEDVDEDSALAMGYSAALFESQLRGPPAARCRFHRSPASYAIVESTGESVAPIPDRAPSRVARSGNAGTSSA